MLVMCVLLGLLTPFSATPGERLGMGGTGPAWPSDIDGWKISEGPTEYGPTTAFKYMDGAAELFLAYNMRKLTVVRYEKAGHPAMTLEVFEMGSPEDAYGLFSFESNDPDAGIGQGSEFGGGLLRFWKGNHFVSVYGEGPGGDIEAATLGLGRQVASCIKETGQPPQLLSYLPDGEAPFSRQQTWFLHSYVLLNQRFFVARENVLDLAKDVDVALGRYGSGKEKVHLLLIQYPGPTRAESALAHFKSAYPKDAPEGSSEKTAHSRRTVAEARGSFVAIVFDAPEEAFARKLLGTALALQKKEGK
jgi:hypothetical protein